MSTPKRKKSLVKIYLREGAAEECAFPFAQSSRASEAHLKSNSNRTVVQWSVGP
jgi:hypothetical protein